MMDAMLATRMRRAAPLLLAVVIAAGFGAAHLLVFGPTAQRYQRALHLSGAAGAAFDPNASTLSLPPRVYTLLVENSMPAAEADQRGGSGALGAELVQKLSEVSSRHALEVLIAEPGPFSQQAFAVQPRAHLRLRGTYANFVAFLDDLARGGRLVSLERFSLAPIGAGKYDIELQLLGCVLRRTPTGTP